jgi:hypothetical protein
VQGRERNDRHRGARGLRREERIFCGSGHESMNGTISVTA